MAQGHTERLMCASRLVAARKRHAQVNAEYLEEIYNYSVPWNGTQGAILLQSGS